MQCKFSTSQFNLDLWYSLIAEMSTAIFTAADLATAYLDEDAAAELKWCKAGWL